MAKSVLLELIENAEILNKNQLETLIEASNRSKKPLVNHIVDFEYLKIDDLMQKLKTALEIQYGVGFIDILKAELSDELIQLFSPETLRKFKFLPLKRNGDIITFAMVDPDNIIAEREIKTKLRDIKNLVLKKRVVFEEDFFKVINDKFPQNDNMPIVEQDTDELLSSMNVDLVENQTDDINLSDLTESAHEAPIIQLANSILGVAIQRGTSDIHIEPREKELIVRYRQDGVLTVYKTLPKKIQNALVSRYKIMAELDIAEKRLPQDGRIRVKMGGKFIDFRVSSLPSKFGEKVVMRILDKSNILFGLDQLITDKNTLKQIREMINRPFGIIFVTGPTGSGKTTTLYSALSERNTPGVNISTVEDPIEYDLPGVTQTEVNKTIGMDFARVLKAFLRQDPDIMLVGETRDKETAKIAVESALTGHLVFTSLHTNDAPGSIMRLTEMEIEPFLISSSTIGVVAQRLLRKICQDCKEEYVPESEILKFLSLDRLPDKIFYKGKGCSKCNGTGYKGRIGAYEVMKINDHLRELISSGANTAILKLAAQEAGMKTLLEYSINLAREGLTTLDEVIRVTFSDEGAAKFCPGCGKPVGEEYYKCPFCQYELKHVCPRCSMLIEDDWVSCSKCGFKLNEVKMEKTCSQCGGQFPIETNECPWCFYLNK